MICGTFRIKISAKYIRDRNSAFRNPHSAKYTDPFYNDFGVRVTSATVGSNIGDIGAWVRYTGIKADFTEKAMGSK